MFTSRSLHGLLRRIGLISLTIVMFSFMSGCGTTHAHIGIDHDIAYNWDGGYYRQYHKPPKHQNYSKKYNNKGKKYGKKHKHSHHHHD